MQGFLRHQPRELRPEAVAYYLDAAEDRSTWHALANDPTDSLRISQRFERLRQDVDSARFRRTVWRVVGTLSASIVVLAAGVNLLYALY